MHESEKWKWKWSRSVMSDPQRPHGLQPSRLLHPRDFQGKSTGVGCHCLLHVSFYWTAKWVSSTYSHILSFFDSFPFRSPQSTDLSSLSYIVVDSWVSEWVKSLSRVRLFATPWTVAYQAPPSMGFSRQEYWSGLPFPSPGESSRLRDRTQVSRIQGRRFNLWATREAQ